MEFAEDARLSVGADDSYILVGGPLSIVLFRKSLFGQFDLLLELGRWIPVSALVGLMAGSASALLLTSLNYATYLRERHTWLILLLAPAGWLIGLLYQQVGSRVEGGNNLILEEVHDPKSTIPVRMTLLVLIGTIVTHVFGGSAGREGTAIQMGASLADQLSGPLRMTPHDRRILLMAGISAGFGSVFGTPLAGAVFGLEVLAIGRLSYDAITPCILSAFAGDLVTHAWGVHHTTYKVSTVPPMSFSGVLYSVVAGIVCGLVALSFAKLTHFVSHTARRWIANPALRPAAGGLLVTAAVFSIGTSRTLKYLGLGIPTIVASFQSRGSPIDFAVKSVFTAITLGTGFKGGEVTPLFLYRFDVGQRALSCLATPAVTAGGDGICCRLLWRSQYADRLHVDGRGAVWGGGGCVCRSACVISYLFSGHVGIYQAQRVGKSKYVANVAEEGLSLGQITSLRMKPKEGLWDKINQFGSTGETAMEHGGVLHLYFSASDMRSADAWWKRIAPQAVGSYLLRQAEDHGIEQALLYRVTGGYLKGQDLVLDTGEIPPARLPQCLELAGDEEDLQSFIEHRADHLKKVRIIFLHGKEAEVEAEMHREELAQALETEHNVGVKE